MVALPGRVMPTSAEGGFVILDTTLALTAGRRRSSTSVTVPRLVKRPYWVRCFVVGGRARLVDPPISSLKEDLMADHGLPVLLQEDRLIAAGLPVRRPGQHRMQEETRTRPGSS